MRFFWWWAFTHFWLLLQHQKIEQCGPMFSPGWCSVGIKLLLPLELSMLWLSPPATPLTKLAAPLIWTSCLSMKAICLLIYAADFFFMTCYVPSIPCRYVWFLLKRPALRRMGTGARKDPLSTCVALTLPLLDMEQGREEGGVLHCTGLLMASGVLQSPPEGSFIKGRHTACVPKSPCEMSGGPLLDFLAMVILSYLSSITE